MSDTRTLQISFGGGIISPELYGRIDDSKYAAGLAECNNFIVRPQGSVENRAGLAFVRATKYSGASKARLIPFTYSTDQTMVLEFGDRYIRFHTLGQTLVSGANPYEIATPYTAADLFGLHYVQSGDVMTLVHPNYAPRELRRFGALNWQLSTITFNSPLGAPTIVSITANRGTSMEAIRYALTVFDIRELTEGLPIFKQITVPSGSNYRVDLEWQYTSTPYNVNIYKALPGGEYRYIGRTTSTSWLDDGGTIGTDTMPVYPQTGALPQATNFTITLRGITTDIEYSYVVTAIASGGLSESVASSPARVWNDLYAPGAFNTVTWGAVSGAAGYNIYKREAGIYGFIGSVAAGVVSFNDSNLVPDLSKTPPIYDNVFNSANNYPSSVTYMEQRRVFAGTNNEPQTVWMTRSGTESDMSYSIPTRDDDRVKFRVAALEMNRIRHMLPLVDLMLLTNSTEFRVTSINKDAIAPNSLSVSAQAYVGSSDVQPKIVNNTLLYCAERGGHVYEIAYDWQYGGFRTGDISVRSPHLFDGHGIFDMAYSKAPLPVVWFTSSSGALLGLTYLPEQQVGAWHRHTTDGAFESCTSVAEGDEDHLYVIVRRTINGATVRYVERMESRRPGITDPENLSGAFFVDSGIRYQGAPLKSFSGLAHLEGKTVSILADGGEHRPLTVSGGSITLDHAASAVSVGLPIAANIKTMPAVIQTQSGVVSIGKTKDIGKVFLRVHRTAGLSVSVDGKAVDFNERDREPYGSEPYLNDGEKEVLTYAKWNDNGQFNIEQTRPLPATILALSAEVSIGG